ncbi:DNA-binding transcriptional regulator LsrR (DeoR family) [Streptomyces sp. LBL]|uniref:sugar-binding domain-containing protein n=1 Tax=Streptomyces sp. LBL TaxID=2940562 RepID=UPI002476F0CB|nr:sugar-binding domain-containing protein [Streptomyces sp. LBL]MDH6628272.1 DNA-binding transcriptional regulator LsrR (DeoR family) [Streptomyces sp. LBL]
MRPQWNDTGEHREEDVPPAPIDGLLAASVARRFYLENQSKVDIAKEFDISRFKVARLLDAAVAHNIVRIDITVPAEIDAPSVAELRDVPELIGISGGAGKAEAVRAVLNSGLLTGIVTDTATARRLLWSEGREITPRTADTPCATETSV